MSWVSKAIRGTSGSYIVAMAVKLKPVVPVFPEAIILQEF